MTTRVLWTIRGLGPGGAEHLLTSFARSPAARVDYDVAYTLAHKSHLTDELRAAGVGVHLLQRPWPLALARLVRSGRYDVVHNHAPVTAAVARLAARTVRPSRRPRVVTTEHGLWSRLGWPTRLLAGATVAADDDRLAVSQAVRASLPSYARRDVTVIVHGLDRASILAHHAHRAEVRAELGIADHEVLVGTVANYRAVKGWPDLLQAARRILDAGAAVRFVGVGQGQQAEEITALHASLGFGDRFLLLGYRPSAARIVAAMDVFALASLLEGLPVAVMEALILGRPVVATDVGGIPEVVHDGREGILVPPSRPDALADGILRLVEDPALRASMGAAAADAGTRLDVDLAVRAVEARYRLLL